MGWKETFAKALGLGDNATEDEVSLKLAERIATKPPVGSEGTPAPQPTPAQFKVPDGLNPQMTALAEMFGQQFTELRKQVDENQRMNLLSNMMTQQFGEIQALLTDSQSKVREAQATQLTEQLQNGKKWALPAQVQNKLRAVMLSDTPDTVSLTDVGEMLKEIVQTGLVPLGEKTTTDPTKTTESGGAPADPVTAFVEKVNKYQADHGGEEKCSDNEALEAIALSDQAGYKAYRNATFIEGAVR